MKTATYVSADASTERAGKSHAIARNALDTFLDMERDGFTFRDGGDLLVVRPKDRVTEAQATVLRANRDALLELLRWRRWQDRTDASVVGLFG